MTAHSKIGASSMYRWSACPGSVKLSENVPSTQSAYAKEGTEAHEFASDKLEGKLKGKRLAAYKKAPEEMREAISVYTDFVMRESKTATKVLIEHRFSLAELYPGLFGTADCVIYFKDKKLLKVIDYKHGAGIPVNPSNNTQLMYYALGALLTTKVPCSTIEMIVVQPRYDHPQGPIRTATIDANELLEFSADLVDFAKATEAHDAPLVSGDHCRFCPANAICPKLKEQAMSLAKQEFSSVTAYDPDKLGQALNFLPRLEAWIKSVRQFAYERAVEGNPPSGFKLVEKRAMRRWKDETEAEIQLVDEIGCDDIYITKLKSPAQIEKLFAKKKDAKGLLEPLVEKVSSGTTLAAESDRRPAVITTTAVEDFTAVK